MPSYELQKEFQSGSPTDCYDAAVKSIEALGFSFVKKRPLGWLLQIKNATMNANLSFRPGLKTIGTFTVLSNTESEETLQEVATKIADAIVANL
jgi:hypothetical protein